MKTPKTTHNTRHINIPAGFSEAVVKEGNTMDGLFLELALLQRMLDTQKKKYSRTSASIAKEMSLLDKKIKERYDLFNEWSKTFFGCFNRCKECENNLQDSSTQSSVCVKNANTNMSEGNLCNMFEESRESIHEMVRFN